MTVDTNVETLIINKLTQAQYDNLEQKDPTQLYIITDVDVVDTVGEELRTTINALITEAKGHATKEELAEFVAEVKENSMRLLRYKGSVETYADLPTEDLEIGDSWNIIEADEGNDIKAGDNAVWTGDEWDILSGKIDLSAYALDEKVVHSEGDEDVYGRKTFKDSIVLERQTTGPILELQSEQTTTYLSVTRGSGSNKNNAILEAGGVEGLVGTKSSHPFSIRTGYTNRMTFDTAGGVKLTKAPDDSSNDNQLATTAWTKTLISTMGANISTPMTDLTSSSGTKTLEANKVYSLSSPSGSITFSLPTTVDNTVFNQILVQLNMPTARSINVGTEYFFNKTAPDLSEAGMYDLIWEWDKANNHWVCGLISKGV